MADTWTPISGYTPQDYTDTAVFEVNSDTKKIALITGQALVAGEENSQYMKFLMPRYWDGIDIKDKAFYIEYALAGTYYGKTAAVNAEYNTEQIRFGWVVPQEACCISGTLLFILRVESTDYILKTQIAEHPVFRSVNVEDVVPEPTKEAWYRDFEARVETAISDAEAALTAAQEAQTAAENAALNAQTSEENAEAAAAMAQTRYGSPLVAQTAEEMVEQNRVYVYTGSETGYTAGHWYYHNGTEWADGGVYNGSAVNTDTTLTQSGMAADAKTVGDELSTIKEDFTAMVNSTYVTDSASGSVAHFTDGADNIPMKSVKVNIAPVQSGSGDPSPDNIRPISGWSAVRATRSGRNFCKSAVTATRTNLNGLTATPNGDGSITVNGTSTATTILYFNLAVESGNGNALQSNGMKNLPNGTYRFGTLPDGMRLQIYGSDVPNAEANDAHFISDSTRGNFTISGEYQYNWVRLSVSGTTTLNNAVAYPALYLASDTEETYEPYNGNTYEIYLSDAGTVYGGTLDAVSGELVVTHNIINLNGSENGWFKSGITAVDAYCLPLSNNSLDGDTVLSHFTYVNQRNYNAVGCAWYDADGKQLRIGYATSGTDLAAFKTWLSSNNVQLFSKLDNPITYNLTPTEVKSLLGINNVWSDAGDMNVQYRADTKLYIDKRLGV